MTKQCEGARQPMLTVGQRIKIADLNVKASNHTNTRKFPRLDRKHSEDVGQSML